MTEIKSLTIEELRGGLAALNEKPFRAKQIFRWLHQPVTSFTEMTDLSKPLRAALDRQYLLTVPQIERKQVAAFMKNRRFRRVKVFRLGIIHDAPAERNHLSAHVDNRKHDAVTETVVNVSPLTAGS